MENGKDSIKVGLVRDIDLKIYQYCFWQDDDPGHYIEYIDPITLAELALSEILKISDKANRQNFYNYIMDRFVDYAKENYKNKREVDNKKDRIAYFSMCTSYIKLIVSLYKAAKSYNLKLNEVLIGKIKETNTAKNISMVLGGFNEIINDLESDKKKSSKENIDTNNISFCTKATLPSMGKLAKILNDCNVIENIIDEDTLRKSILTGDFSSYKQNNNKYKLGILIYWLGNIYFKDKKEYKETAAKSIDINPKKLTSRKSFYEDFANKLKKISGCELDGKSLNTPQKHRGE